MGRHLSNASPQGKAVLLLHELQAGLPPEELRELFLELAPESHQRSALADAFEELLRQYRYAPADIWRLMETVCPERSGGGAPPMPSAPAGPPHGGGAQAVGRKKSPGKRTQRVKSPFLKPFDDASQPTKPQPVRPQQPPPSPPSPGAAAPPPAEIPHPAVSRPAGHPPAPPAQPQARPVPPGSLPRSDAPPPREPAAPASKKSIGPDLRDVDKTGMFGATLKGLDLSAVQPKTKARVLVADDDHRIRLIYRTKLEENGYTVIEAENGMEAWRLVSTGEADIAVLDMKMPGYHGLDVLGRMSDAGMDIPVIISTAYDQLSDEFVVATYPRLKYLVKPVDPNTLVAAVEEFYRQMQ